MKVYNSLIRKKEEFVPLKAGHVSIYVCGITAYDSCHLGHARAAVAFDAMVRYLRFSGFKVKFVRNYTDIDDKIINRANTENRDWKELAEYYVKEYAEDMAALGNLRPDIEPRATDHIKEMIGTIKKLMDRGLAYRTEGGVYFSVRKFKGYGRLSGKNIEDLEAGARVDVDEKKQDPLDFALWKAVKPNEPKWPSPWGDGRPGWHIECSAMSSKYLGQPFDIHGGGRDLIFPHHENEIAQAEGAEGKPFVKYWLHNGFVNMNAEKMSKSLGNIMAIREILKKYDFEALRYFILSNHYRSPLDYTEQAIGEAMQAVDRFYEMMIRLAQTAGSGGALSPPNAGGHGGPPLQKIFDDLPGRIKKVMDDDFNTAGAMGVIFDLVRLTNKFLDLNPPGEHIGWLGKKWVEAQAIFGEIFGIFATDPSEYQLRRKAKTTQSLGVDTKLVEQLIVGRAEARKARDFARADIIKKQLTEMGVELRDRPDGSSEWKIK